MVDAPTPKNAAAGGTSAADALVDVRILESLAARQPDGLRQLLVLHGGLVAARLKRSFGRWLPAPDLEDALATAIVRIWEATAVRLPVHGTLRAWFWVITRNCALNIMRSRPRHEIPLDQVAEFLADLTPSPTDRDQLHLIADFQSAMAMLPPLPRAVLHADLDVLGTAPALQLAARFGVKPAQIHQARSRGRSILRATMQRLGHYHRRLQEELFAVPGAGSGPSATAPEAP